MCLDLVFTVEVQLFFYLKKAVSVFVLCCVALSFFLSVLSIHVHVYIRIDIIVCSSDTIVTFM